MVLTALPAFDISRCGIAVPVLLLLAFTVASRLDLLDALASLALLLAGGAVLSATDPQLGLGGFTFVLFLAAGAFAGGRVARSFGLLGARLQERTRLLELERGHTARLATEVERRRLGVRLDAAARGELARIVDVSRQGETAAVSDPEQARRAFAEIERTSRATLDEIRGVLGSLRQDGADARQSTPTLAELDALIDEARATGRAVRLDVDGEPPQLGAGLELSLYRLLQHTLAAVDEQAPLAVHLRYRPDHLELEVRGPAASSVTADEALHAARERASVHGGSFRVASADAGQVVLRALLPVTAAPLSVPR